MRSRKTQATPARLEAGRRCFGRWPRTRKGHSRIPDPLWTPAAKLAGACGLCRTARTLGLDFSDLKQRVAPAALHDSPGQRTARQKTTVQEPATTFVELAPPAPACSPECIAELEDPRARNSTSPSCPGSHEPARNMPISVLSRPGSGGIHAPMLPVNGQRDPGVPG